MKPRLRLAALAIVFTLLACPAFAAEIALFGGYEATNKPVEKTYAWQLQYMEGLGEHFAYRLAYLNQGHFISHHRDANAASLWLRGSLLDKRLSQAEYLAGLHGSPPVLLIDDIMGELDLKRRSGFLPLLQQVHQARGQVFMTATERNWPNDLAAEAWQWTVREGKLSR